MVQVLFHDMRVFVETGDPIIFLREEHGPRTLAVWVTATAATTVLAAMEVEDPDHPATHDLLVDLLSAFDLLVERVDIVGEADGVFDAQLQLNGTKVTCRVSDGVAIALRVGAPIHVDDDVMARCAGASLEVVGDAHELDDTDVEEFLEFLDNVTPEDFDKSP